VALTNGPVETFAMPLGRDGGVDVDGDAADRGVVATSGALSRLQAWRGSAR